MQFEINFWRKFLAQFHSRCAELSWVWCVCVCAGVGEGVCLSVCELRCFFPTGLRFAVAFSANHFNVIFYIISLIYQTLYLSLPPSLSLILPLPFFLSPSFPLSLPCAAFISLFSLIHCWHASLFNYHDLVRCLWLSTVPPSPLCRALLRHHHVLLPRP